MPVKNQNNYKEYFADQVKKYIAANYTRTILCEDVARHVGYATSTAKHLFKEVTGTTIAEYLRDYRIGKLKELLISTNEPFSHLILKVGYQSLGRTHLLFKERVGVTPKEYRKMNLQ